MLFRSLKAFYKTSEEVVAEVANQGALEKKIFESYSKFRKYSMEMADVTEFGFIDGRNIK